ncbi:hypothetical protein D3C71_1772910 [compost metagenome]
MSPSPIRLTASTVTKIATPGNRHIHQARRRKVREAPTMYPQVIRLGSPRPRKLIALSSRMALATISEAMTISGDTQFGRISANTMWVRE